MTIAGYRIRYGDGSIRFNTGVRGWRQLPTANIVAACVFYVERWAPDGTGPRVLRNCIMRANEMWVDAAGTLAWGDAAPAGTNNNDRKALAIGDMDRTAAYWTIANAAQSDWQVPV